MLQLLEKEKEQLSPAPILQQTDFWGRLKELQGRDVHAFDITVPATQIMDAPKRDTSIAKDLLITLRPVGSGYHMAYVPYGPTFEPKEEEQGPILEELSESMRRYLPKNCVCIRYDLPWESRWAHDETRFDGSHDWLGAPRPEVQEIRMNFNTHYHKLLKAPTNVLPENTIFLNLQNETHHLLQRMKPKTRYNIRLSQRRGVRVVEVGSEHLDIWYRLYRETALRHHINLHERDYFETMFAADQDKSLHLLLAEAEDTPLAAMFLAISESQAVYLYGASSMQNRNKMATYTLQWEAICRAKQQGCTWYDMFGVSPSPDPAHPMYGLYRFKSGFGGMLYHRQGCWDYPLDEEQYMIYRAQELNDEGYHIRA